MPSSKGLLEPRLTTSCTPELPALLQVADRRPGTVRPLAARLGGVDIPNQKRIETSLQYIYGICLVRAKEILEATVGTPLSAKAPLMPCLDLKASTRFGHEVGPALTLRCAEH